MEEMATGERGEGFGKGEIILTDCTIFDRIVA